MLPEFYVCLHQNYVQRRAKESITSIVSLSFVISEHQDELVTKLIACRRTRMAAEKKLLCVQRTS